MKLKIEHDTILLNKKQLIEIKKLDHMQMNGFLTNIYQEGIQRGEGKATIALKGTKMEMRRQAWEALIRSIDQKGIGETRKQSIKVQFRKEFGEENESED